MSIIKVITDTLKMVMSKKLYDGQSIRGNTHIRVIDANGKITADYDVGNTVTALGDAHVADQMSDQGNAAMSHMAVGTGTGGTTTLNAEDTRVALDSTTQGTGGDDNDVVYVASFTGITGTITEAGIFNDASAGTMFVYNASLSQLLGASDTLQITWTVTFGST